MKNTCCYGCEKPKRHIGCHSTCPDYLDECKANEKEKREIQEKKRFNREFNEYKATTIRKTAKRAKK